MELNTRGTYSGLYEACTALPREPASIGCLASLDSVNAFILRLVGCHAALTDWGCFFRERCCGEETHNMTCRFVSKVLFWFRYLLHCTTHHQFICTVGKQSGIYKAMYSEPVHPSVFTDATGTPSDSRKLQLFSTDLPKSAQ